MPSLRKPWDFEADLNHGRLATIAAFLMEEWYATEDDLTRSTDSRYTRGCTAFGRMRDRIILEAQSKLHGWLEIASPTLDLVFQIGRVPCRFATDDVECPRKPAVREVGRFQRTFFDEVDGGMPCRYVFILDRGIADGEEPRVVLHGYGVSGELLCEWESDVVPHLQTVDTFYPPAVELDKPHVGLRGASSNEVQGNDETRLADVTNIDP